MYILHITCIYTFILHIMYILHIVFLHIIHGFIHIDAYICMCHGSTCIIGRDGLKQHPWGLLAWPLAPHLGAARPEELLSIEILGILFWSDSYWPSSWLEMIGDDSWEFIKKIVSSSFEIWNWHLPGFFFFFYLGNHQRTPLKRSTRWNKSWTSRRTASHQRRWMRRTVIRCGDDWGNQGKLSDGWWFFKIVVPKFI